MNIGSKVPSDLSVRGLVIATTRAEKASSMTSQSIIRSIDHWKRSSITRRVAPHQMRERTIDSCPASAAALAIQWHRFPAIQRRTSNAMVYTERYPCSFWRWAVATVWAYLSLIPSIHNRTPPGGPISRLHCVRKKWPLKLLWITTLNLNRL